MHHKKNAPIPFWSLWWSAIDQISLMTVLLLIGLGTWLVTVASPAVALQHQWTPLILLKKHVIFVVLSVGILLITSFLSEKMVMRCAVIVLFGAWCAAWLVLLYGTEIKGARRWLTLAGFSLQPSELMKPALTVVTAHILCLRYSMLRSGILIGAAVLPLFLQPDVGMIFLIGLLWFAQLFVAGLAWIWTVSALCVAAIGMVGVYCYFPHVAYRIQTFITGGYEDPFGSHYQILQALKGFSSGGWYGKGPGGGVILNKLPDGHADFIFAVAGEEMGALACIFILGLYGILCFRNLWFAFHENNRFCALAITGLTLHITMQTCMNMASVLRMMPTKGVTLPFLSYGGSSLLSTCWAMGMILALTKRYRSMVD